MKHKRDTTRTTLTLPTNLVAAVDREIQKGGARSRNALIARALRRELASLRRREIDAAYARLAADADVRAEALRVAEEFAQADWEVFRQAEGEP